MNLQLLCFYCKIGSSKFGAKILQLKSARAKKLTFRNSDIDCYKRQVWYSWPFPTSLYLSSHASFGSLFGWGEVGRGDTWEEIGGKSGQQVNHSRFQDLVRLWCMGNHIPCVLPFILALLCMPTWFGEMSIWIKCNTVSSGLWIMGALGTQIMNTETKRNKYQHDWCKKDFLLTRPLGCWI